jgi:hypothetical protein
MRRVLVASARGLAATGAAPIKMILTLQASFFIRVIRLSQLPITLSQHWPFGLDADC